MIIRLTLVMVFLAVVMGNAQTKINWMTIEEAYAKQKITPKKVLIDVYTDWCGWCKKMDKSTFRFELIFEINFWTEKARRLYIISSLFLSAYFLLRVVFLWLL